jgi:hypothetical protein
VQCRPTFTRGRGSRSLFQYDITLRHPDGREWTELVSGVAWGGANTKDMGGTEAPRRRDCE